MAVIPPWVGRVAFVLAAVGSVLVVRYLDRGRDWGRLRRKRLLLGIPWGTLLVSALVLSVYLFLQGGLDNWHDPVVVPFLSWSYFYPLGIVVSGFAHLGVGHLIGNLVGTLVFGSIAEYAYGHFPQGRGETVGSSLGSSPYVRALLVFPAVTVLVGLLTGVFSLGPTIGFSGVVFAFAGFALTRFPIGAALGLLVADAVRLAYRALQRPTIEASAGPSFGGPWWAGISIQGHLMGLLVGVALGLLVFPARSERRSPLAIWTGVLFFTIGQNLWALWWFRGNNTFVLFRGLGLWFVLTLSLLVALALTASDRPMPRWLTSRRLAGAGLLVSAAGGLGWWALAPASVSLSIPTPAGALPAVPTGFAALAAVFGAAVLAGGDEPLLAGHSRREVARLAVLLPLVFSAAVTVPTNVTTVGDARSPGDVTIDVRDYQVTYAENVTNEMVSVLNLSILGETTRVQTSGVIVISESRHIWTNEISKSRLKFTGRKAARVGGVGWRAKVIAVRRGWSAAGGPAAYKVYLRAGDGRGRQLAYRSEPAVAAPRLAGTDVAIRPSPGGFAIELRRNDSVVSTVGIPGPGNATTASGITFVRNGSALFATFNGTRIKVGNRESYE
ncbi:MAG: rhomboid family intramembrane serine protease [Halobacteriales archaeon]